MVRSTSVTLLALLSTGCVVYDADRTPGFYNAAPYIEWAEAGCAWDGYYRDTIWYFEAGVSDADGAGDVMEVWADVYDERSGAWIDGFELFPAGGTYWFSDWLQASTWLDCTYPWYVVEFVAYDYHGAEDWLTVVPWTY